MTPTLQKPYPGDNLLSHSAANIAETYIVKGLDVKIMEATNRGACKDVTGFSPYGKPGQGEYSRDNLVSHSTADIAASFAIKALDNLQYDPNCGRPFTICEFGAADGLTSVNVMNHIIERVRGKYGRDVPITIIYEDRPTADFNSLFLALSGELKEPICNYPAFDQNVFLFATGREFFEQCLPNGSLDFAYSALSVHYMSKRPCQLKDVIHVAESCDLQERALFAAQAAKDWCTFLLHRGKELVPGGQMILCVNVIDDLGQHCGKTRRAPGSSLFDYLAQPWKEMIQEGRITQEEFADMAFNNYYHSVEEYKAPFQDPTSAVYRTGLRIMTLETHTTPCPVQTDWLKREDKEDTLCRQEFAQRAVSLVRRWTNWLFMQALTKGRTLDESVKLVEEFWKRFENLAATNLEKLHIDNPLAHIWIEKVLHK